MGMFLAVLVGGALAAGLALVCGVFAEWGQ